MRCKALAAIAIAIAAGGCGLAEEPNESTVRSELYCGILSCGTNAPTVGDGILFDEIDLFGRPNYSGVAMTGANLPSGAPVQIQIWHDILYAVDPATSVVYSGYDLMLTEIHFVHRPTGVTFDIRVDGYDPQSVSYRSGAPEPIPVYDFKARRSPGGQFDFEVCNHDGLPVATEESWPGIPHHALVYRGDRYDSHKRLIPNSPSDGWSFIACNGSAATKMQLWRHTYAGGFDAAGNPTYMTNLQERTTLLKAITADYCGTGAPQFTVFGTPLAFATSDEPASFPLPYTSVSSIEAMWGPNGATCLDRPRREGFGVTRPQVEKDCGHTFPRCAAPGATLPPTGWFNVNHVVTANP
jgi:hypothetical protein